MVCLCLAKLYIYTCLQVSVYTTRFTFKREINQNDLTEDVSGAGYVVLGYKSAVFVYVLSIHSSTTCQEK